MSFNVQFKIVSGLRIFFNSHGKFNLKQNNKISKIFIFFLNIKIFLIFFVVNSNFHGNQIIFNCDFLVRVRTANKHH